MGYTKKAFEDEDWIVRLAAYTALGFTEKSLQDESIDIRSEAECYFLWKKIKRESIKKIFAVLA